MVADGVRIGSEGAQRRCRRAAVTGFSRCRFPAEGAPPRREEFPDSYILSAKIRISWGIPRDSAVPPAEEPRAKNLPHLATPDAHTQLSSVRSGLPTRPFPTTQQLSFSLQM